MGYSEEWLKEHPENFPVASWLLPHEFRAGIMALYAFARGTDNLADDKTLPEAKRKAHLIAIENALVAGEIHLLPEWAQPYGRLAQDNSYLLTYGRDLISAFIQDTTKSRYRDYNDLLDYCRRSAVPIGRAFLTLCYENDVEVARVDALCYAMQLLNHIRDCADDYVNLGRVYLPLEWFTLAGAPVSALAASESTPALYKVIDRGLDNCDQHLRKAEYLLGSIHNLRLRKELAFIMELARALSATLRKQDPLQDRVTISRFSKFICLLKVLIKI